VADQLEPFQMRGECPKCHSWTRSLTYCLLVRHVHAGMTLAVDTGGREHIDVTCQDCGYRRFMETADAPPVLRLESPPI